MATFAVILSGCGVYDGSEIYETTAALLNISKRGFDYACFAPDVPQMHVINHRTGECAPGESRSVLTEAARLARGEVKSLKELDHNDFDALVVPGGFGAAKNLCTFATEGADCVVNPDVERVVTAFHEANKPIAMCCIAPVIAAKVLGTNAGGPGCSLTIGNDHDTASAIASMGARNIEKPVTEAIVDEDNLLITAPAYMYGDAKIHEVEQGIADMIERTVALLRETANT